MWCSTECWDCEDKKCEHYISKTELYFENQRLKNKLEQEKNKIKEVRDILEPLIALEGTMTAKGMKKLLKILDKEVN